MNLWESGTENSQDIKAKKTPTTLRLTFTSRTSSHLSKVPLQSGAVGHMYPRYVGEYNLPHDLAMVKGYNMLLLKLNIP